MNIPEIYWVGAACACTGALAGLVAGFCLGIYAVADLSRGLGETFNKSPKGK